MFCFVVWVLAAVSIVTPYGKLFFFSSISLFNALLSASGRSYIMISIVFIVVFNNLCHCQRFCNVHKKHCLISVTISILHNQAEKTT